MDAVCHALVRRFGGGTSGVTVTLATIPAIADMGAKSETTLPCSKETRDRIREKKSGGEPYESVLTRLLDHYEDSDHRVNG